MKPTVQNRRNGFSLVELLLTLVLILCLAAASVFCYTAVHRQANLDEGVDRLQSVIRFARAEAATTGRKIRIGFVNATPVDGMEVEADSKTIQVQWEPDFLTAPGVFQVYSNKSWSEEIVNELVAVQKVKPIVAESESKRTQKTAAGTAEEDLNPTLRDAGDAEAGEDFEIQEMPAITFYPDGSCDSAEIIVSSRNEEDPRRMAVTVSGILGSVSAKLVSDTLTEDDWLEEEWETSEVVEDSGSSRSQSFDSGGASFGSDTASRQPLEDFSVR